MDNIQFNELVSEQASNRSDADSDYCGDLADVYHENGTEEDVEMYRNIHQMDKGNEH